MSARRVVCLIALALAGCVYPTPPIEWDRWRETFPEHSSQPVEEKVAAIEAHLLARHLSPEGLLIYRRSDTVPEWGKPGSYASLADTPIWTGCLAAAWAFKYGVTKSAADRALLLRALRGLEILQGVTGVRGLLARAAAPKDVPVDGEKEEQSWRAGSPGFEGYRFRGDVSKDQYFGTLFGYAATAVALGLGADATPASDPEILDRIRAPVAAIADHFWENGLRIVDVDGETTTYGDLSGYVFCIPIGPNALLSLAAQLLAWRLSGEERFRQRYLELVRMRYPEATWLNKFQIFAITNHNNDVMAMMGFYMVTLLDGEPERRRLYQENLRRLWNLVLNEGNLLYHGVWHAASGQPLPSSQRRDLLENFRLFPADLHSAPRDARGLPAADPSFFDTKDGEPRNRSALPLHLRQLSSFIWKSNPYSLASGSESDASLTVSGVDFLLVYWLARFHGLWPLPEASEHQVP